MIAMFFMGCLWIVVGVITITVVKQKAGDAVFIGCIICANVWFAAYSLSGE